MTRDVYVGVNLAEEGRESWYYSDKVNYVSTLFNQEYSHRTAPFLSRKKNFKKNARVLLRRPMIYCECGEHIWKTFLPAFRRA